MSRQTTKRRRPRVKKGRPLNALDAQRILNANSVKPHGSGRIYTEAEAGLLLSTIRAVFLPEDLQPEAEAP